jgi:hypothetical protein
MTAVGIEPIYSFYNCSLFISIEKLKIENNCIQISNDTHLNLT